MSKTVVVAIIFVGNSENTFHAGQLVTGHVHVETSERIKIRGIQIQVTGKGKTKWAEQSDDKTKTYVGREEYMNTETCLIGSRERNSEICLEPSAYKYPFNFTLPAELPQSFEDKIGRIRYKVKAVIDRRMNFNDKAKVRFTVIRLLDLNLESPQLREPQVIQIQTQPSGCYSCCTRGFAKISVTVNRGCFVPGETISIHGEIINRTNAGVEHSTIAFVQNVEYCATNKNNEVYHRTNRWTTLGQSERPSIRIGHTDSWNDISFVVPKVLSSWLDGCGIINIRYYIEINVTLNWGCGETGVTGGVVIGNVPLQHDFQPSVVTTQPKTLPVP